MAAFGKETNHKITDVLLKKKSQEFDIGSIHILILKESSIFDLGCIGQCTGLIRLDLSDNNISTILPLRPLKQLQDLNLSRNRISTLIGAEDLDCLRALNIAGNLINSVDSLYPLVKLPQLESLRLKDRLEKILNPVCDSDPNYKFNVLNMLPDLKILDGELLSGKGGEFFSFCDEMDRLLAKREEDARNRKTVNLKKTPWPKVDDTHLHNQTKFDVLPVLDKKVADVIVDCIGANEAALKILEEAELDLKDF